MKDRFKPFIPISGMRNRHLQTVVPIILGRFSSSKTIREEVLLADGDFVDLDWTTLPVEGDTRPVMLIFHGLEGSSGSHYAKTLMQAAKANNWIAVVMNFRGCSGRQNRMSRLYHSGETGDAAYVIDKIKARFPQAPLYAVGFSLGGNMLLKLAGEQGSGLPLKALVAVSAPVKLSESVDYMMHGLSRFYQTYLLRSLKRKLLKKYSQHDYEALIGLHRQEIVGCKNIREFDNLFTSRIHGFRDAEDYYEKSSAYQYIATIKRPCLMIHSQDDPVVVPDIFPAGHRLAEHIDIILTPNGGHVGFLGGGLLRPEYWLANTIMGYFSRLA